MTSQQKHLPAEVWTLIFATLAVKTLFILRCVCKTWCSIIDDHDFIDMHFKLCKNNIVNDELLALEGFGLHGNEGCRLTVRRTDTLRKSAHIFESSERRFYIYGSCNGLILMGRTVRPDLQSKMMLWNPSIRKSLQLPHCAFHFFNYGNTTCAFGFAPCIKDYKVVLINLETHFVKEPPEPTKMRIAVYTLTDQQWTSKHKDLNIRCSFFNRGGGQYYLPSNAVYFRGAAHWFGSNLPRHSDGRSNDFRSTHLVSLDFDMENFSVLELPFQLVGKQALKFLFVLRESLAIFSMYGARSSIWVLKQDNEKGGWAQWFSGNSSSMYGFDLFHYFERKTVIYSERDGGCFICGSKSYNIASGEVKELGESMSYYVDLQMYSESLVLFKGYGAKDLTCFT